MITVKMLAFYVEEMEVRIIDKELVCVMIG